MKIELNYSLIFLKSLLICLFCNSSLLAFDLPQYRVNVNNFGAKGDSVSNDTAAFQAANDHVSSKGGGVVYIPALMTKSSYYKLTKAVIVSNGVYFVGDGDGSFIKNEYASGTPVGYGAAFVFGIVAREDLRRMVENGKQFRLMDITHDLISNKIELLNKQQINNFAIGDVVIVSTSEWIENTLDKRPVPNVALWTVIKNINNESGVITLRHNLQDITKSPIIMNFSRNTYNKATLTNNRGINTNLYAVRDAGLLNLKLEGGGDKYPLYVNGAVNCRFENLTFKNSNEILRWNSLSHSVVNNINGSFDSYAIELALNSHSNLVSNIKAQYVKSTKNTKTLVLIGERSNRNVLRNININANGYYGLKAVEFRGNDNVFEKGVIVAENIIDQTTSFAEGNRNKVIDSKFTTSGTFKSYWGVNTGSYNEALNNIYIGRTTQQAIQMSGGSHNISRGNFYEYKGWYVSAEANNPIIESNTFTDDKITMKNNCSSAIIKNNIIKK